METRWRRKDGTVFPVLLNASSLHPANPDDGATFTALDLSIRKQEIARVQASEERYRRLHDVVAEGVVYQNARGDITSANPAAERILGLSRNLTDERIATDPDWQALREDGTEWPSGQHPWQIALHTGLPMKGVVMGWLHRQSGEKRWLRVSAIPLFESSQEKPSQVCSLFYDITENVETTRKLALIQQELSELAGLAQPTLGALSTRIAALDQSSEISGDDSQALRDCARESLEILQRLLEKLPALSTSV
jgi:PAS domain S-box-containing protein